MTQLKRNIVRVIVDYGYDVHTLVISGRILARIEAGRPVIIEGQGFPVEGVIEPDQWAFNFGAVGAVRVSTDTGREVFEGSLGDAEVDVRVASLNFSLRPTGDPASEVN